MSLVKPIKVGVTRGLTVLYTIEYLFFFKVIYFYGRNLLTTLTLQYCCCHFFHFSFFRNICSAHKK